MMIDGVPYSRFRISFRLASGKRRRWIRWSVGQPWIDGEIARELEETFSCDELPSGSNIYIEAT